MGWNGQNGQTKHMVRVLIFICFLLMPASSHLLKYLCICGKDVTFYQLSLSLSLVYGIKYVYTYMYSITWCNCRWDGSECLWGIKFHSLTGPVKPRQGRTGQSPKQLPPPLWLRVLFLFSLFIFILLVSQVASLASKTLNWNSVQFLVSVWGCVSSSTQHKTSNPLSSTLISALCLFLYLI